VLACDEVGAWGGGVGGGWWEEALPKSRVALGQTLGGLAGSLGDDSSGGFRWRRRGCLIRVLPRGVSGGAGKEVWDGRSWREVAGSWSGGVGGEESWCD
jgi:hypothetical protein